MIQVIIAKPTRACNADCSYCSAPPYDDAAWSYDKFCIIWDRLNNRLHPNVQWIWHGGEPMLLKPAFYEQCADYAKQTHPNIQFSIQSNLLLYKTSRWKAVFEDIFKGRVSTSYEPSNLYRTIKGDHKKYSKVFFDKLEQVINDGFKPSIIGTFSNSNIEAAYELYEYSKSLARNAVPIKINYIYPSGRASEEKNILDPRTYTNALLQLWKQWREECPGFDIEPLSDMLDLIIGNISTRCPWMNDCGGKFLSIEPNGDLYNCSGFADLREDQFRFGNIFDSHVQKSSVSNLQTQVIPIYFSEALKSAHGLKVMKKRRFNLADDCLSCEHFQECKGGCQKDAYLFTKKLGGKFYYCHTWKTLFHTIKSDLSSGKADKLIRKRNPDIPLSKIHGSYAPGENALPLEVEKD